MNQKKHYENIMELEKDLFDLVNEVINGYKGESDRGDSVIFTPKNHFVLFFDSIRIEVKHNPFAKINVIKQRRTCASTAS